MVLALGVAFAVVLLLVLAMAWTMPARTLARYIDLPPQVLAMEGPLRRGRARLEGGYRLDWALRPAFAAAFAVGVEADVAVSGPDTQLDGVLMAGLRTIGMRDLTGRAGSGLLKLAPGLGLDCDSRAVVDVTRAIWSRDRVRAEGGAQIDAGACRIGAREVPLPASEVILAEVDDAGLAMLRTLTGTPLGSLRLTPARDATLTVEPQGAALVTGSPTGAAMVLELPF